jgi:two-component system response regulator TctD
MRALVIEDNCDIAECIVESLKQMEINSDWFKEGVYFERAVTAGEFDIIVLDINLPDACGFSILKKFRSNGGKTPVLIISARISVSDRVMGLDLGADDYLVKPFALDEFEARVRALLRRESQNKCEVIEFGDLSYNQNTREFLLKGIAFDSSPRERAVLEILIQKKGEVMSKESIAHHIFSFDDLADPSAIEIYIHRIRKKLGSSNVSVATKRGLGYALKKLDDV